MRNHLILASLLLTATSCSSLGQAKKDSGDPDRKNPFSGVDFFVNPAYSENVLATAKKHPELAADMAKVAAQPTAMWLDSIAQIKNMPTWLDQARAQQTASGNPTLSVFIVYDMPDRDCSAEASAGELKISEGGAERYRTEYIDGIAAVLQQYSDMPVVLVVEPDSLGNMATNMGVAKCAGAKKVYEDSVVYAIKKFQMPNVSLYLDAAHSGWLGWDGNRQKIIRIFRNVIMKAGGPQTVRGFATNVSNYTPLNNNDGKKLEPTNPCFNEMTYVKKLAVELGNNGLKNMGFIIDTARNGAGGIRRKWGYWCNIKGAGLGERPRADPAPFVDAYFWLKPPGESDGVSDPSQPRFDPFCKSPDSVANAPQAGQWFESYFVDLVQNAVPPLATTPAPKAKPVAKPAPKADANDPHAGR